MAVAQTLHPALQSAASWREASPQEQLVPSALLSTPSIQRVYIQRYSHPQTHTHTHTRTYKTKEKPVHTMYKTYECAQKRTKPALFSHFRNARSFARMVLTTAIHPLHQTRTGTQRRWLQVPRAAALLPFRASSPGNGHRAGGRLPATHPLQLWFALPWIRGCKCPNVEKPDRISIVKLTVFCAKGVELSRPILKYSISL